MTAKFSANGKRLGRPPKTPQPTRSPDEQALAIAKQLLKVRAQYDAGGRGRRMANWNPPNSGPNNAIVQHDTIRSRSRDATRNDWSAESSIQKWTTSLVGIGITPRFRRIKDKARRQEISDLWARFVSAADADCILNLYGMQTLGVRAWLESGEVFLRRRPRVFDPSLPVPMQLQLLESDMVPMWDTDSANGLVAGNVIRSGIELDKRGTRIAYWVFKKHPGDKFFTGGLFDPSELVRVAASQMRHIFEPKRPGQLRGVSTLAPILARLRSINDFEDATLERQKIANLFVAFITKSLPTLDPNLVGTGALSGLDLGVDDPGTPAQPLVPMGPGIMQELEDGQQVTFANPPEAGTKYSEYMRTTHMASAAAAGLPYELYSGDIMRISDRTLRVLINEFRRFAEQRQWQIIIPQFCQPVVEWFADAAAYAQVIKPEEIDLVKRVEHAPHGWQYLHPVQDVQGKALEVASGFRSRSSVVGERGDDIDQVDIEREQDQQREKDLGLSSAATAPAVPPPPGTTPAPPPAPGAPGALAFFDFEDEE